MKTWQKPRLVVLARGKPEEAILTACKTGQNTDTSGPHWEWDGCVMNWNYSDYGCFDDQCAAPVTS
jgi:hypothetical protein